MRPKSTRIKCWHFSPEPGPVQVTQVPADPANDTEVVAVAPPPDLHVGEVWTPTFDEYRVLFPTVYFTPLLIGGHVLKLRERGQAY